MDAAGVLHAPAKGRRPSALVAVHRSPASSMQEVSAVTPLRLSDHLLLDDPKPVLLDQLSSSSSSTPKASSSAVRKLINHKIQNENVESAFFVADLGAVVRQHRKWQRLLPRIEPYYAIKCNTDPQVLRTLLPLCGGFDCASMGEITTMLDLGVSPDKIIYANPCKPPAHIRYARDRGVHLMTFDNEDELHKVKKYNPNAKMVLRILTDDSKSVCRFGTKFGAHPPMTFGLLQAARDIGLDVVGVSFHVGSGCQDPMAYDDAVRRARRVFEEGESLGFNFNLLDVGGGFPGTEKEHDSNNPDIHGFGDGVSFERIAAVLGQAIDEVFPDRNIRVIAEPGRYYAAPAFTLATTITSRRVVPHHNPASGLSEAMEVTEAKSIMYYIDDGVYGSFNCLLFDHAQAFPKVLGMNGRIIDDDDDLGDMSYESSVWGPTCDSMDCITRTANLPELQIGDWLLFEDMGAYTVAAASRFNGFDLSYVFYTNTEA